MLIDRLLFELSCKNTETQKHGNTEKHTDSDEYSIVALMMKIITVPAQNYLFCELSCVEASVWD